ncbi:hypothetical protein EYF80_007897 [Liparis tanakae]|uniref:Uncharacterized protein n=1 Tax=Liparis tanakae TaxID=230148 RepID=A0A4Z2IW73_9TELE|nr:hypothetical protein EYF80_007897 [Liparis tanakae]
MVTAHLFNKERPILIRVFGKKTKQEKVEAHMDSIKVAMVSTWCNDASHPHPPPPAPTRPPAKCQSGGLVHAACWAQRVAVNRYAETPDRRTDTTDDSRPAPSGRSLSPCDRTSLLQRPEGGEETSPGPVITHRRKYNNAEAPGSLPLPLTRQRNRLHACDASAAL